MINTLKVYLYGMQMETLLLGSDGYCTFQYTDTFCRTGLKPAPLTMPAIPSNMYRFPILSRDTFNGLPEMIADALPYSFGQKPVQTDDHFYQ